MSNERDRHDGGLGYYARRLEVASAQHGPELDAGSVRGAGQGHLYGELLVPDARHLGPVHAQAPRPVVGEPESLQCHAHAQPRRPILRRRIARVALAPVDGDAGGRVDDGDGGGGARAEDGGIQGRSKARHKGAS